MINLLEFQSQTDQIQSHVCFKESCKDQDLTAIIYEENTNSLCREVGVKSGSPLLKNLAIPVDYLTTNNFNLKGLILLNFVDEDMANRISASDMKSFRKDALATHNKYRDLHGVPSLKMNDKLNDTAQKWADYLVNSRSFTHSEAKDYGENLCSHYSSASTEYSGTYR